MEQFINKYFDNLKSIKQFRSNLKQFNHLLFPSVNSLEATKSATLKPLIKQVCDYLVKSYSDSSADNQLVDIELRTTTDGIKDLFKLKLGYERLDLITPF